MAHNNKHIHYQVLQLRLTVCTIQAGPVWRIWQEHTLPINSVTHLTWLTVCTYQAGTVWQVVECKVQCSTSRAVDTWTHAFCDTSLSAFPATAAQFTWRSNERMVPCGFTANLGAFFGGPGATPWEPPRIWVLRSGGAFKIYEILLFVFEIIFAEDICTSFLAPREVYRYGYTYALSINSQGLGPKDPWQRTRHMAWHRRVVRVVVRISICSRGARLGHPTDSIFSVQNKHFSGNTKGAYKSSWSGQGNQRYLTLTIPWNLANPEKTYPGIILRQHRTDRKQMGLLREQCVEWMKVRLQYQVWMKNGGQLPWKVKPFCETFKISCLLGCLIRKTFWRTLFFKDQSFRLVHWLSIALVLRTTSQKSMNLKRKSFLDCSLDTLCSRCEFGRVTKGCRHWGAGNDSEIYTKRLNAKEEYFTKMKNSCFQLQMDEKNFVGEDQELRTSTLIRDHPIRGEGQRYFLGESAGSPPPLPQDSYPERRQRAEAPLRQGRVSAQ